MTVIDTSVWVFLSQRQNRESELKALTPDAVTRYEEAILPVAVRAELLSFATRAQWGRDRRLFLTEVFSRTIPYNDHLSLVPYYVAIETSFPGRTLGKNDLWIAACAAYLGLPLVTFDRDFAHLGAFFPVQILNVDQLLPGIE
jgi:tRNA(fMet)-specific endonuclease VapC